MLKHLILKYYSHPVLLLWWNTSGPNLNKFEPYLGEKGPRNPQKGSISWLLHRHENVWKFITLEPQMLGWWNLPQLFIAVRPLIWQKIGAWPIGRRRVRFSSISWNFQDYIKNGVICNTLPCTVSLVKISKESDRIWGSYDQKTTRKQPKIHFSGPMKTFEKL